MKYPKTRTLSSLRRTGGLANPDDVHNFIFLESGQVSDLDEIK